MSCISTHTYIFNYIYGLHAWFTCYSSYQVTLIRRLSTVLTLEESYSTRAVMSARAVFGYDSVSFHRLRYPWGRLVSYSPSDHRAKRLLKATIAFCVRGFGFTFHILLGVWICGTVPFSCFVFFACHFFRSRVCHGAPARQQRHVRAAGGPLCAPRSRTWVPRAIRIQTARARREVPNPPSFVFWFAARA